MRAGSGSDAGERPVDARALAEAITRRAEAERAELLRAAADEAAALLARARADAEAVRAAAAAAGRQRGQHDAARLRSQAQMELLAAESRLLDDAVRTVMAQAAAALRTARDRPDYPEIFRRLLHEALAAAPPGAPAVVRIDPRDSALVDPAALPPGTEVVPTLRCAGGVVVEAWAGAFVADNTLEARLRAQEPALRAVVGRVLTS